MAVPDVCVLRYSSEPGRAFRPESKSNNITKRKEAKKMKRSNQRVVGLDVHPDSFAGAILSGTDPWKARVESTSTRVALALLEKWVQRHTSASDVLVMEASGNAFAVAE